MPTVSQRFEGKTAIVTGGGSGIGRATAIALGREGASVVVVEISEQPGQATADTITKEQGRAIFVRTDVTREDECRRAVEAAVKAFGRVDVLANVAGGGSPGTVLDLGPAEWERVLRLNLTSVYFMSREAIARMRQTGGGAIVSISSSAGVSGAIRNAAYAAAKGGIIALTKSMALDHVQDGIRVNCVAPGGVLTPLLQRASPAQQDIWGQTNIFRRLGQPEEIAEAVLFLASEQASFITGQTINAGRSP